ncbi:MAG: Ig-like domain-containing protein, partial [Bacteroidales bacterium]|nr:Ig-like domain-containing protein [Bacteroidales bacterium]
PVYGEFIPVASISLDKTSLELNAGDKQQLTATVSPSNATAKDVHWISSDESIAKVDGDGLVTAVAPGTATITAYGSSGVSASCTVTVKEGVQAVDLGLPSGLKWASCNVGATKPEQFGDYFSWGETETKNEYTWSTYKWGNGDWDADEHLSKYNTDPSCGNVDGNTMLLPEDDVAQDKWKGGWRMPTDAEWTELRDYCTWTWTVSYEGTGVAGYIVEGTKNSSIFLPATGHMEDEFLLDPGVNCGYWSSNIDPDNPAYAWFVYFEEGGVYRTIGPRKYGYSVRPVTE